NTSLMKLIGFMAILIIVWTGATLLGAILSKLTSESGLGFLNRLFGFIAGGGKYFLIFALIVTALSNVTLVKESLEKYVKDSVLYPYLKEAGSYLINLDTSSIGLTTSEMTKAAIPSESNTSNTEMNTTSPTVTQKQAQ
ncbi:MAG TPA: CvpA family protein, partial [Sulfurovum sp.]|nr:CvpA family protein [Sulfurovum sp.]